MKLFATISILLIALHGFTYTTEYSNNSVLRSGSWIKVSTTEQGVHKISYEQLSEWGISSPENVSVYSNGGYMLPKMNNVMYPDDLTKIPVLHSKDNNNSNAIFFYSTGSVKWTYNESRKIFVHQLNLYSEHTYFYITSDGTKSDAPTLKTATTNKEDVSFSDFNDYILYEEENINLLKTGRRWFSDELMHSSSKNYSFEFENRNAQNTAFITISGAAESSNTSKMYITDNDVSIGEITYPRVSGDYKGMEKEIDLEIPASTIYDLNIQFQTDAGNGTSWLDFITINQQSKLELTNDQVTFRNSDALQYTTIKYQITSSSINSILWDISDPLNAKKINTTINGNTLSFKDVGQKTSEYVLFNPQHKDIPEPIFVDNVKNQNIHGLPLYDFVIITHPDFISASETLAEYHRQKDDMSVLVVTTDEVYNEFSSGLPDVASIRNMNKMFYDRKTSSDSLRFVLLMGDGSFNNRDFSGKYSNYIPTYQSVTSIHEDSFVSDDFYALLDDNEGEAAGYIDVGIGRIPCQTIEEAEIVVNKTTSYLEEDAMGDWRNVITFMADDEDNTLHMTQTESVINIVEKRYPGFNFNKIYFDAYTQISTSSGEKYPEATEAINRSVEEGTLILNYMGHANEQSMAHEDVLTMTDFKSWGNKRKLPVFVTATCEFSRYDDTKVTAGETILLNPAGGGVALFSTSRLVYASSNFTLTKNFYNSAFHQDSDGNNYRMGDIMRFAKNNTKNDTNKRNFSLLGDPALQLAFPKYDVKTKSINGTEIRDTLFTAIYTSGRIDSSYATIDTVQIGALDIVTIESEVVNNRGECLESFNGTVTATVYDKEVEVQTLANDEGTNPFPFKARNNVIYKGTSTVVNGKFEFSFVVPKDIAYNIDLGKIYYYVSNNIEDGNGTFDAFKIGGTSKTPFIDDTPPEVKVNLNNKNFNSYDKVSSSALLMIDLFDESGINTVGTGIGHDIVAVLDEDYTNQIQLNNYYSSQLNSYQHGQVLYPLNNLSVGEHTLSVKVWDVQNNSTYKEIHFIVEEGFEITSVLNYPNPVEFDTRFEIAHNLPGDVFDVTIELFNLRGKKIYQIDESTGSYDDLKAVIRWDISETNIPINLEKILIYRVTLENLQGLKAYGAGKLVLKNN